VVLPRYLALVAANLLLSFTGIKLLTGVFSLGLLKAKIMAETLLFFLNFAVQRDLIFTRRRKSPEIELPPRLKEAREC